MKEQVLTLYMLTLAIAGHSATVLHHYDFNAAEVTDSVGSANGKLLNGATVAGGLLHLDGVNDYVQFGENLIPTSGAFAVAFFAREIAPGMTNRMEMISQGGTFAPGFYLGYYGEERLLRIGDTWQTTGVAFPQDGGWHHYAVTSDDREARLYLDGKLAGTQHRIRVANTGSKTRLGRQFEYPLEPWFGPEMFRGNLDELWVFNGALTAHEVAALARMPGSDSPVKSARSTRQIGMATVDPMATAATSASGRAQPVRMTVCEMEAGQLRLAWEGVAGRYVLERSLALGTAAVWVELPRVNPEAREERLPLTGTTRFFRVFRVE